MFMNFSEWLVEDAKIPNIGKSLGKMRHGMPQLGKFDSFLADLKKNNVKSSVQEIEPKKLIPTQKNFNQDKVDSLKAEGWDNKPIISSKDNYVVDGHHRWLAAHQKGQKIKSRVIDMNCEDLLDFLDGKKYVEKKKINEETE